MKVLVSLLFGAFGAASAVVAGTKTMTSSAKDEGGDLNTSFSLPDGYIAVPFSMDVVLEPGSEPMTFNGTVTEIFAQIQSIKPDFTWVSSGSVSPSAGETSKFKRSKSKILCNVPSFSVGLRWIILKGYDYLKTIHQDCKVDAGPKKCAMLYCEIGTSIWMCNDNKTPISRDCGFIADYALDIIADEECQSRGTMGPKAWTNGQEFDTDNFNVIAGGGGCDGYRF